MCGVLARYKGEFEKRKEVKVLQLTSQVKKELNGNSIEVNTSKINQGMKKISLLNAYIWTFCSALWRNKLLIDENETVQDLYFIPK